MCNPRAFHPALYDSAFMKDCISEADIMVRRTSVYESKEGYKKTSSCVFYALKLRL